MMFKRKETYLRRYSPEDSSHYRKDEGRRGRERGRGRTRSRKGMKIFIWRLRADSGLRKDPAPRKDALISAYDGYVSQSETPTRPHSAPSTPIVRLIYVFSRVIRPSHPYTALVEEGRSPWRRRASRRPIVGRLHRVDVGPTRTRRTIIIDGEGRVPSGARGWSVVSRDVAGIKSTIEKRRFTRRRRRRRRSEVHRGIKIRGRIRREYPSFSVTRGRELGHAGMQTRKKVRGIRIIQDATILKFEC